MATPDAKVQFTSPSVTSPSNKRRGGKSGSFTRKVEHILQPHSSPAPHVAAADSPPPSPLSTTPSSSLTYIHSLDDRLLALLFITGIIFPSSLYLGWAVFGTLTVATISTAIFLVLLGVVLCFGLLPVVPVVMGVGACACGVVALAAVWRTMWGIWAGGWRVVGRVLRAVVMGLGMKQILGRWEEKGRVGGKTSHRGKSLQR